MGNQTSAGNISVVFANERDHMPGSEISGHAVVRVNEDTTCSSIDGRIRGFETTKVMMTPSLFSSKGRSVFARQEKSEFFQLTQQLASAEVITLAKGENPFPFQFTIPKDSPATMEEWIGSNGCEIAYYFEVNVKTSAPAVNIYTHKQRFEVQRTGPIILQTPVPVQVKKFSLTTLGTKTGTVFVGTSIVDQASASGSDSCLKYVVTNLSNSSVQAVEITVRESIAFQAGGIYSGRSHVLFSKRIEIKEDDACIFDTVDALTRMANFINEKNGNNTTKIDLSIPSTAHYSHFGKLITVRHTVHVQLCTPTGTSNPSFNRVVTLQPKEAPHPSLPLSVVIRAVLDLQKMVDPVIVSDLVPFASRTA